MIFPRNQSKFCDRKIQMKTLTRYSVLVCDILWEKAQGFEKTQFNSHFQFITTKISLTSMNFLHVPRQNN